MTPPESGAVAAPEKAHPYLDKEQGKIRRLFDRIAPRYDLLNHLLSFNLDRGWRRRAIRELRAETGGRYLDVCAGTGDLAFTLDRVLQGKAQIYASDFSVPMLHHGERKRRERNRRHPRFLGGDTLRLPFPSEAFDGATVAFGIRNVENFDAAATELARVLRPGARLVILEFTPVRNRLLRPAFHFYCHGVVPFVGNLISRSKDRAYSYLQQSIDRWPPADELAAQLKQAGFREVTWKILFPGNVALHTALR